MFPLQMSKRLRTAADKIGDEGLRKEFIDDADALDEMCKNFRNPFAPPADKEASVEAVKNLFKIFNADRRDVWKSIVALEKEDRKHWSGFVDGPHVNDLDWSVIVPGVPPRAVPASSASYVEKPHLTDEDIPNVNEEKIFLVPMVSTAVVSASVMEYSCCIMSCGASNQIDLHLE